VGYSLRSVLVARTLGRSTSFASTLIFLEFFTSKSLFDAVQTAVNPVSFNWPIIQKRQLRIVKPPLPAIGVCEACNSQFKSTKTSQHDAENEIKKAFDAHECKVDSSQRRLARGAEPAED
jgi:hypothetical protein